MDKRQFKESPNWCLRISPLAAIIHWPLPFKAILFSNDNVPALMKKSGLWLSSNWCDKSQQHRLAVLQSHLDRLLFTAGSLWSLSSMLAWLTVSSGSIYSLQNQNVRPEYSWGHCQLSIQSPPPVQVTFHVKFTFKERFWKYSLAPASCKWQKVWTSAWLDVVLVRVQFVQLVQANSIIWWLRWVMKLSGLVTYEKTEEYLVEPKNT